MKQHKCKKHAVNIFFDIDLNENDVAIKKNKRFIALAEFDVREVQITLF